MAKGFKGEMDYGRRQFSILSAQSPKERNAVILQNLTNGPDSPERAARRKQIEPLLRNEAYVSAELRVAEIIQAQLAEVVTWPESRYQIWSAGIKALLAQHPIAELLSSTYDGVRAGIMASTVRREMLAAGLGMLNGRTPTTPDSVTGAPFLYAPTATGFELRSKFVEKGKPVTMQFDQRR